MSDRIRILYVDDYALDRELVKDALEQEDGGFEVVEAASRAELEVQLTRGSYDLVLSDFNIAGFDGLEVIDLVRVRAPNLPVVIVTGTGSELTAVETMKRGAADYVIKTPHHIQRLPSSILAALERQRLREERRRGDEALRASEERFRSVVQTAGEAIVCADASGTITFWNRTAESLFGHPSEEAIGRPMALIIPERLRAAAEARLRQVVAANQTGALLPPTESVALTRDGREVPVEMSLSSWTAGGKLFVTYVAHDITDRQRLEEQLLRAQRLEMAGQIAGQVAHDFGNLLVPIVAYPDLIKMLLPPDHPAAEMCDAMLQAAQQMAVINEDLLTLGRRARVERESVDLNDLVQQALGMISDAPATLSLELDPAQDLFPVAAAPSQLVRVISNLVSNARDAMQDRGHLVLRTESIYVDGPFGRYNRVNMGEYVRLSVADTGCGIPDGIKGRIFDAFFTTKRSDKQRGSGLGLAIVQAIVDDHHGYIDVESEVGRGTTFLLYLPVLRETAKEGPAAGLGGTERILVVDDDRHQREVLQGMLRMLGYQVETAPSGDKALEQLRERPPDLLILDMAVPPGMDGVETYRRALLIRPGQRAITISGFTASEHVEEALSLGAGAHLRKPANLATLAAAVRKELDRAR